jgi:hypothetical protein
MVARFQLMPLSSRVSVILGEPALATLGVILDYAQRRASALSPTGERIYLSVLDKHVAPRSSLNAVHNRASALGDAALISSEEFLSLAQHPDTEEILGINCVERDDGSWHFDVFSVDDGPLRHASSPGLHALSTQQRVTEAIYTLAHQCLDTALDADAPPALRKAARSQLAEAFPAIKSDISSRISADAANKLEAVLREFEYDVFGDYGERVPMPPDRGPFNFQIQYNSDNPRLPRTRPYRLPDAYETVVREFVQGGLQNGTLLRGDGPHAAPVLVVKQPNKLRVCIDYRRTVNLLCSRESWPLPIPEDTFHRLRGSKYFTSMDLKQGYWQVPIQPGDEHKAAFMTSDGVYIPRVLQFGMANAPSHFMRFVSHVLRAEIQAGFVELYIDDLLIHSRSPEEHIGHVHRVLNALRRHSLIAQGSKCHFFKNEVTFLGHVITAEGITVEQCKVNDLRKRALPSTVTELRSWLGVTNHYRRFIPEYSNVAAPLTDCFRGSVQGKHLKWTPSMHKAFDTLLDCLTSAPILRKFDPSLPTFVAVDASETSRAVGGVLSQQDEHGMRPVAYFSRKMNDTEMRYGVRDKELLACKECLQHWRMFLLGRPFTLQSDHKSLQYLRASKQLTGRPARWQDFFSEYDFNDIVYVKGCDNVIADLLSRPPRTATPELHTITLVASSTAESIKTALQTPPPEVKTVMDRLRDAVRDKQPPVFRAWSLRDDLLYYDGRIYVPTQDLRVSLLREYHDDHIAGHQCAKRMLPNIARAYFWPSMRNDVYEYVRSCGRCQACKPANALPLGQPEVRAIPSRPGESYAVDIITSLPLSARGHNAIVTWIDLFSNYIITSPATSSSETPLSAEELARHFIRDVVAIRGFPSQLTSDCDSRFQSAFWQAVHKALGTTVRMTTTYHPQSDPAERAHRMVLEALKTAIGTDYDRWDEYLPLVQFALNSHVSSRTGMSPFFLDHGWEPRIPADLRVPPRAPAPAKEFIQQAARRFKQAHAATLSAQQRLLELMRKRSRPVSLHPGDRVWMSSAHVALAIPYKLTPKWLGPYTVTAAAGNNATLALPASLGRRSKVVPLDRLRLYHPRDPLLGGESLDPAPLFHNDDGDPYYRVERIFAHRADPRERSFLVRWAGYDASHDSWEPEHRLRADVPLLLDAYLANPSSLQKRPTAPLRRSVHTRH